MYLSAYTTTIDDILSVTGENPGWSSSEPYYDSFYCNVRPTSLLYGFRADVTCAVGYLPNTLSSHVTPRPPKVCRYCSGDDRYPEERGMAS